MDGPPPEFATAAGVATFTPCGDRRWRVAVAGSLVGELVEAPREDEAETVAWATTTEDGRSQPWRQTWMAALADLVGN
jgi:hypothetical protein